MSLSFPSNNRSHLRRRQQVSAPAEIEAFESRLLLTTTPGILSPSGVIDLDAAVDGSTPTVEFSWEAVDNAVSYDLWVSSLGSFEQILLVEDISGTTTDIAVTDLAEGRLRVWARANLAGGGVSAWSTGKDFELNIRPVLTGPGADNARHLTSDTTPEITWAATNEAQLFQLWLTDLTTGTVTRYNVDNLTPLLDDNGDPVLDFAGRELPQEIRSYEIPDAGALQIGRYRLWIRSIDIDGAQSGWSDFYEFDIGPSPVNLRPDAPSFSSAPLLTWDAVSRATEYEVFVVRPNGGTNTPIYRETTAATGFQIPTDLAQGQYVFWVRAIIRGTGIPTVFGAWSAPSRFGTLVPPTVTGPVATGGFVTELRPTVEWTPIHGAATYEVLVHKRDSRPPFLQTLSNATSLTFATDLAAGSYTVWVRAVNTRGGFSDWSDPQFFRTTGGRTVITAPPAGGVVDFPTFTWIPVADAVSYEVWISEVGGRSPFLNVTVAGTSYTPIDPALPGSEPFPDGTYRIWVRAISADGTTGPWSRPVIFMGGIVVENDDASSVEIQLASLESAPQSVAEPATPAWHPDDSVPVEVAADSQVDAIASPTDLADETTSAENVDMPVDVLAQLATDCAAAEWWADRNSPA